MGTLTSRRIETALPDTSFGIVEKAASLSGMTLKSFAAMAIMRVACEMVREINGALSMQDQRPVIQLDAEESKNLLSMLKHPEEFSAGLNKALKLASKIPQKSVDKGDEL